MSKRKWLRRTLISVALVVGASFGFSYILQTAAARRYLISRLVASFGRPVEVGRFDFSLVGGGRLRAESVTVAEDPQFGNEYFLRAEALTAGVRWAGLLSGRFEFDSVSLLRPSLNLTKDAHGRWNIQNWLPPVSGDTPRVGFVGPSPPSIRLQTARLHRLEVDSGRINFKQMDTKSPFALLDVSGRIAQDNLGRWELDLEARPMRAGVELQDIGTLRLRGSIAGTSARLQPAALNLSWREASIADALRLVRQLDYGMRGELSLDIDARVGPPNTASIGKETTGPGEWSISGVARFRDIHGWRLPGRDSDPAANVSVDAMWRAGESRTEVRKLLVEMADSHLQGAGELSWGQGFLPQLHVESSSLGLDDILSWYRALHPGVQEDLRAEGTLGVTVTLGGWPIQIQQGAISSMGGSITGTSLPAPLQIGPMKAIVSHGGFEVFPASLSFSAVNPPGKAATGVAEGPDRFLVHGAVFSDPNGMFRWPLNWNLSIDGTTSRAQDWLLVSDAFAQPLNQGWTAAGGVAVKMRGAHRSESPMTSWLGTMDFHELSVSPAQVNQPVQLAGSHVEFTPQQRTVTFSKAEALGTIWDGTISRKNADKQWTFDLSADRLDTTELDRWLGPRARTGFLARFTRLGGAAPIPQGDTAIARMTAHGRLRAGEIVMGPMRLAQFDGDTEVLGRNIKIRKAHADFFGGRVDGMLDAHLLADPSYAFQGKFDRVNLEQLADAVPSLNGRMDGTASATLSLSAHGVGRQALIGSMDGKGSINARNTEFLGIDLTGVFPEDTPEISRSPFISVNGGFVIRTSGIDLSNVVLDHSRGRLQVEGRIDFSHALNLRVRPLIFQAAASLAAASPPGFVLTGTIEEPKLSSPSAVSAANASKSRTRGR